MDPMNAHLYCLIIIILGFNGTNGRNKWTEGLFSMFQQMNENKL